MASAMKISPATDSPLSGFRARTVPENSSKRLIPPIADLLAVWRYVEHSALRILAGWGRSAGDWEDKKAMCYHVWLQAESVDRLRGRLEQFPPHKPEMPVTRIYEDVLNSILLAPSFHDAMIGLHAFVLAPLTAAYQSYLESAHPVHDHPTHDVVRELLEMKQTETRWYADFLSRYPEPMKGEYEQSLVAAMGSIPPLDSAARPDADGKTARPCGRFTEFAQAATPGRVKDWNLAPNVMPLIQADWSTSVEARRLFFMIGYFWEMGVAEEQLRWVYYADFMPWEFTYAEARHLWDESRHGDSGLARLRDFGLDIKDIGYSSYGAKSEGVLPPLSPDGLYERFYFITQIAERGYFKTKSYCFDDFAAGGDSASSEMMQFDIIDETSHAEFGRQWLDALAKAAGKDEDWNRRGAEDRAAAQRASDARVESYRQFAANTLRESGEGGTLALAAPTEMHAIMVDPAARAHYQWLLSVLRSACPLQNAQTAPVRPNLPL